MTSDHTIVNKKSAPLATYPGRSRQEQDGLRLVVITLRAVAALTLHRGL
jgi:hypothetical protein